jgi:hypothetical protein
MERASLLRRWLLALLVVGLAGTEIELLLLAHYEDGWQVLPLVLIAAGAALAIWHTIKPGRAIGMALNAVMVLCVLAGGLGIVLHGRGAAEFQLEIDPSQSRWTLMEKVMRAKAPPVLAPGMMVQLGLLGLIYSYVASGSSRRLTPGATATHSEE